MTVSHALGNTTTARALATTTVASSGQGVQRGLTGPKVEAQVLATALSVYATTSSLGGSAGAAYGFTVSAAGLGARTYNVGSTGTAFGVANNTTLNV